MELRNRGIPVTDDRGRLLCPVAFEGLEPEPGSVVLANGPHGTAWQRHFTDGLWRSTARIPRPISWEALIRKRNLILIYDAPPRGPRD